MALEDNDVPLGNFKKNNQNPNTDQDLEAKGYNLSGKVMLSSIILLFFVVVLMFCLHIYARWYLRRARRRQLRRHRELRRSQLVFQNDAVTPTAISRGLDAAVLATLPVFTFNSNSDMEKNAPECAVCLSEFEPGETGRILPKCNHSFHTECIDMWFHSHATCPLCRSPVERASQPEAVVITVTEPESSSASDSETVEVENPTGSSSSVGSSKPKPSLVGVTIEVPPRGDNFQHESGCDSPSTQLSTSFRSPMSRMLSFTRMLGRERKGNVSPSSSGAACSSAAAEYGAERGEEAQ